MSDMPSPVKQKRALMSTASWIALFVGILMTCLGAVFIANAQAVTNTIADDRAIIQKVETANDKQDDLIQSISQNMAAQTANINNLTETVRNLTSLIQGHVLREGK